MSGECIEFDFNGPTIISKSPVTYEFTLTTTTPAPLLYSSYSGNHDTLICDNIDFIKNLINVFSRKCSKFFSKPLSIDLLLPRLKHKDYVVNEIEKNKTDQGEENELEEPIIYEWRYTPYKIQISGTEFTLFWCVDEIESKCVIDIDSTIHGDNIENSDDVVQLNNDVVDGGGEKEVLSDIDGAANNIKEHPVDEAGWGGEEPLVQLSPDNIPVGEGNITLQTDEREEDMKQLTKARLRVKIARFKMEREYERYIQKWGYLSEDSGSDSD